jgi:hypothetical protein
MVVVYQNKKFSTAGETLKLISKESKGEQRKREGLAAWNKNALDSVKFTLTLLPLALTKRRGQK